MGHYQYITIDDFQNPVARSHLYRYYCARGYVEPSDIVVDAACGVGYGTELISRIANKVIGMDRDQDAIKYAMEHHKRDNNYFVCQNLDQIDRFPDCDVLICVETFEHLRFPESFAAKVKQSVRKKIFLTCPIVPTTHQDSTHLHDFDEQQVYGIFVDDDWGTIDSSKQEPYLMVSFYRK
jgi:2-polyprenyl-3-methyl-5-hydroxy-6-metoxy-1,4-benzoquinol methylase